MSGATATTLELLKNVQKTPDATLAGEINKAWNQSGSAVSGITAYDLEAPAKILFPVLTPLRNMIPRVTGGMGIQANWRGVTGVNTTGLSAGVSGGNRGGVISMGTTDYLAAFRGLGLEDYVTFEAQMAGQGFDDVRALATQSLLKALMLQEEVIILGGNSSTAIGTTPTPTVADVATGGTIAPNSAQRVYAIALTLEGWRNSTVAAGIPFQITRTNADGSTDTYGGGSGQISAVGTVTTANDGNSTHSLTASVTAVAGAFAYAWYWGTAGNELLGAITTVNKVTILATATGTQNKTAAPAADYSRNTLIFDGLLAFAAAGSTNNAYYKALATDGTLTADGTGGIVEFDTLLRDRWDNFRLSPDAIWVNAEQAIDVNKKVLAGASNGAQRFVFDSNQGKIAGGTMVASYLNKFGQGGAKELPIKIHPNMPPGTVLFTTAELPYPMSNVSSVLRILCRRDYYQIDWPQRSRKYETGVYSDEVLQNYFPPALGMITNIKAG